MQLFKLKTSFAILAFVITGALANLEDTGHSADHIKDKELDLSDEGDSDVEASESYNRLARLLPFTWNDNKAEELSVVRSRVVVPPPPHLQRSSTDKRPPQKQVASGGFFQSKPLQNKQQGQDQFRPEQPRPEQLRPDQPRPEQAQARPDQLRPEQARPDQPRPEQARPDQLRPEQARPIQPRPEQMRPEFNGPPQKRPDPDSKHFLRPDLNIQPKNRQDPNVPLPTNRQNFNGPPQNKPLENGPPQKRPEPNAPSQNRPDQKQVKLLTMQLGPGPVPTPPKNHQRPDKSHQKLAKPGLFFGAKPVPKNQQKPAYPPTTKPVNPPQGQDYRPLSQEQPRSAMKPEHVPEDQKSHMAEEHHMGPNPVSGYDNQHPMDQKSMPQRPVLKRSNQQDHNRGSQVLVKHPPKSTPKPGSKFVNGKHKILLNIKNF